MHLKCQHYVQVDTSLTREKKERKREEEEEKEEAKEKVTDGNSFKVVCTQPLRKCMISPGSYGSTLRYKSVERIKHIGKHSLLGASGEISDFQEILRYLDELM
ncbi:hypothetical protein B296_00053549 [Ensete ventricosum]|uniref:Uncharacterized protein n=1 Tax=Ensete ventricosum TaxID=4639 RepID=A0A426XRZ9_ENSVE|nr:hypothetical protein B296_00053549 [Ensete ventricosum]